ncbi:MAG: KH domain-containing protein [Cellulosilyticaceae bacterium]
MKNLVEVIARELVDYPEQVSVSQREDDQTIIIELKVAPEDMGKIIGKQGRIAKAIRSIVKSASATSSKKVVVEIMQ